MSTRYDELTKILGTGSAGTPSTTSAEEEQKQTSRRDELFSLFGASEPDVPATADTGTSTTQSIPALEKSEQETLQQTTPQSAAPTAPLTQGSLAGGGGSAAGGGGGRGGRADTRADLQRQLNALDEAAAYVTTTEQSDAIEQQRRPIIEQLRQMDEEEGRTGVYTGGDRLKNLFSNARLATQQGLTKADHRIAQTADWLFGGIAKEGRALLNTTLQSINPNWGFENEDPLITQYNKRGEDVIAHNEAVAQKRIEEGRLSPTAWKYAPEVVAAIPDAVLAYFTAGASSGAQATSAGLEAASAAAQAGKAAQTIVPIANATKNMIKNPAWASAFAQTAGSSYEQALAEGATEDEANLYALLNGFANATIEVGGSDEALGGIQKLPQQLRDALEKGNNTAVMRWIKSTVNEAGEEVSQGMAEKAMRGIYTNDVPLYSATDENAVINPTRAKEEALGGLVVGGLLGGGQSLLQAAINENRQSARSAHTAGQEQTGEEAQAAEVAAAGATPQSTTATAPIAGEPLQEAQTQATETAQDAQRVTPQAETPPTTQDAAQAASDALNRQAERPVRHGVQTSELGQAVREAGVDPEMVYNELNNIYGAIPTGETPARDVQVPQRISEEEAVGRTARTIMEAAATPDKRLGSVREAVVGGKFSYTEISNQELADSAAQRIESDGWQKSLTDWTAAVRHNQADENLAAMGAQLLNNAGNSDMSAEQYIDLATDYNRLMHNLGRGLAAARILKTLSPEGKLYGIQRSIQNMVDEANGKYNVEIDPALIDEYRAQTTDEGRDAVISKMQQNIADQVPSTWMDKFTAMRYTNMLGNFKTQIRNVGGNILMTLGRTVKDKLAAVIESAASAASGGKVERTKSLWAGTPLYGEAMRDFTNVEREAMGESKYSDSGREFDLAVQEKRTIFKNNGKWGTAEAKTGIGRSAAATGARKVSDLGMAGMEAYRKATNWAMEQGDRIFVRINYADALAGWLKAHGISSIAEADAGTLDRARQYAIKQAQEATFRDTNSVSQFVSTFDKGWGKTGFGRGAQKVMQGIAPFRKTPANVAVRAEEYSPLGILNTAYKAFETKQGKNDVTWSDVIDSAAKTLTGSGIYALGYLMAAAGSARGKEEDEKKAAFESMRGMQDYSIILPNGKSVSMNWLAPYSIPFFMGVLTQEAAADGGLSWDDAGKILGAVGDPMLEMSMLSGLNDALDNISQYNGDADALPQFLMNAFASYLSQGVTNTLLGQFEQASQETRQTTYTDSTLKIPTSLQYILGKASAKTPGVDYNQQDYIDAWGRKQSTGAAGERIINSFINPAYVNEDRSTPVDDELQRLYDAGQTNVLPQKAARSTKVNGERLSPEEYEAYSITKGQQSLELVQDFIESDAYKDMSDEARAKVISDLYSFAASRAAKEITDGRKESYTSDWDDEAELPDVVGYLTTKSQIKTAQDSKDYTLLDALVDTVSEQQKAVQEKLNKDFSMLDELIYGKEHGVDAETIYTAKTEADANGNGKISQEELWYYLGLQKNMPEDTKDVLWDILTTGKTGYAQYAEKQK